jgi:hypothetical protein
MQKGANIWKVVFVLLALIGTQALACTLVFPRYDAGPSFTVRVASPNGHTFKNVRVVLLANHGGAKRVVLTDERGLAQFNNLDLGEYSLSTDMPDSGDEAAIFVSPGQASPDIKLTWPWGRDVSASAIRGKLLDARTARPYSRLSLRLIGFNGKSIADFVTNTEGNFDFGTPSEGLYFVQVQSRVKDGYDPSGMIPFLVTGKGSANVSLSLSESSCGMAYSDVCHSVIRDVSRISGSLVDSAGAEIPGATIELFSVAEESRPKISGTSSRDGSFAFESVAPGDYEVVIRSLGFAPMFMSIRVNSAATNPIGKIRMSIAGSTCESDQAENREPVTDNQES